MNWISLGHRIWMSLAGFPPGSYIFSRNSSQGVPLKRIICLLKWGFTLFLKRISAPLFLEPILWFLKQTKYFEYLFAFLPWFGFVNNWLTFWRILVCLTENSLHDQNTKFFCHRYGYRRVLDHPPLHNASTKNLAPKKKGVKFTILTPACCL